MLDTVADPDSAALSLLGNRWELREADGRAALAIAQRLETPEIVGRLLAGRGIALEEAFSFLHPTLKESLPDPSHFKDMDKAAARVARAVTDGETVGVFGDYDVDGATSSALLIQYFRALGVRSAVHIPDRRKEGYGPNAPALLGLKEKGASLIITVDCGTVAFAPLAEAKAAGLEVIVIDHHKGESRLPEAFAVVNPNRMDETSPHTHLAAVGMTFLLLVAVNRKLRERGYFNTSLPLTPSRKQEGESIPPPACGGRDGVGKSEPDLRRWLDLVALGTVCDVAPLTGVNRAFAAQGIKTLARRENIGLRALCDIARLEGRPDAYHLGFLLGPRINAGGRVGQSDLGVRLLTAQDETQAKELAAILDRHNSERQAIEAMVLEEALAQAEAATPEDPLLLVRGEGWHEGVIGIVAGRLKEAYDKPAGVIAIAGGVGKGSARSVAGIDIGAAVAAAHMEGLLLAGGGHAMAAGFTVAAEKIPALEEFLRERLAQGVHDRRRRRTLRLDAALSLSAVTPELAETLERLGPFGQGNPQPRLLLSGVRAVQAKVVGKGHVQALLAEGGVAGRTDNARLRAVAFRAADTPLGRALLRPGGAPLHVAGQVRLSEWQGSRRAEFHIIDAAEA